MTTENPNHPSDRTGDGPLPLLSYDILLQDMGLDQILTTTVAEALVQEARDTPWSEVWKDFPTAADNGMPATHYRGGLADSPAKKYSMVIRGGRLEILYGWSGCRPLAVAGSRQAGLIGDRMRHPRYKDPSRNRHWKLWNRFASRFGQDPYLSRIQGSAHHLERSLLFIALLVFLVFAAIHVLGRMTRALVGLHRRRRRFGRRTPFRLGNIHRTVPYGGLTAYVRLAFTPIIDQILSGMSEYVGQRPGAAENQNVFSPRPS